MTATWEQVQKDGIDSFSYDEAQGVLEIKFLGSGAVHGFAATPEIVHGLREAEQKNIYFLNHIKPKCRRLPGKG